MVVSKGGGKGEGIVFNGNRVSVVEDENILEMGNCGSYRAM